MATPVFVHSSSGSSNPAIAVASDGTVHLAWQENTGTLSAVYYMSGNKNGSTMQWGTAANLSSGLAGSVRPAIAVGTGGLVYVAWGEKDPDVETQYVRFARSENGGATWSSPQRVDPEPVSANSVAPTEVSPALAVVPAGAVCVAWHGFRAEAPVEAEEIYLTCSDDRGVTWGSPVNVSRSSGVISIRPALAVGSDGILHMAWQEMAGAQAISDYQIMYAHSIPCVVYLPIALRTYR